MKLANVLQNMSALSGTVCILEDPQKVSSDAFKSKFAPPQCFDSTSYSLSC